MKRKINKYIKTHSLFEKNNRLLVGVSGGMDSVSLCHFLSEEGYSFEIAHVNYGLRTPDADLDEKLVRDLGLKLKVPVHFLDAKNKFKKTTAIQEKARKIRYLYFRALLKENNLDLILTAHHSDDSAETMMLNYFRGSGPNGLSGIPKKRGNIRRPFLAVTKREIEEFAVKREILWREDDSNLRSEYNRNFIRNELIPRIEERWNGFAKASRQTAAIMEESSQIIDFWASSELMKIRTVENGITFLDLEKIRSSIAPVTLLHFALKKLNLNTTTLNSILAGTQAGREWYSDDRKYRLLIEPGDKLSVEEISDSSDFTPIIIHNFKNKVETSCGTLNIHEKAIKEIKRDSNSLLIDGKKLQFPLHLRLWRAGDYFHPEGMKGNKKKLKAYLTDLKLGKRKKEKTLVLCSRDDIVWVLGLRADERFTVKDHTRKKDILSIEWIEKS